MNQRLVSKTLPFLLIVSSLSLLSVTNTSWAAPEQELNFKVWLDDREIGRHDVRISESDQRTSVFSKVKFKVKMMFINLFSYNHRAEETWDGDCLASIDTYTKSNGREYTVKGQQEDDAFKLSREVPKQPRIDESLEPCIGTYAYWDLSRIQRDQLLNTQTGEVDPADLIPEGVQPIPRLDRTAQTYRLKTDNPDIRLWYSDQGEWLALETSTDGRQLVYLNETLLNN